jgi:hypothetical protein
MVMNECEEYIGQVAKIILLRDYNSPLIGLVTGHTKLKQTLIIRFPYEYMGKYYKDFKYISPYDIMRITPLSQEDQFIWRIQNHV